MDQTVEKINRSCMSYGEIPLAAGIRLEDATQELLDVDTLTIDVHVALQPAAIAYYGSLLSEAQRHLFKLQREYDRWEKEKTALAKASLAGSPTRATKDDAEARFIVDNRDELSKWDEKIDNAKQTVDIVAAYFEGWKQKSFAIKAKIEISETERYNVNDSASSEKSKQLSPKAVMEAARNKAKE